MGESFDHCPAGWIRQRRKCWNECIHNHMVVDGRQMSMDIFASRISIPWSLNLYTDA